MAGLEAGARWFPLDFRVRQRGAVFCSEYRWPGSGAACRAAIRRELAVNPYALDMRRVYAGLLIEAGIREEAVKQARFVRFYAPHIPLQIPVNVNPATR